MSKYKRIAAFVIGTVVSCGLTFTMPNVAKAVSAPIDDWVTQDHDMNRTGLQLQNTGITKANVNSLKLRWAVPLGELVYASPIVANGTVYVSTGKGNVYALKVSDGKTIWKTNIGDYVRMTPTLADGLLFVGNYGLSNGAISHTPPVSANMTALDVKTGKIVWKTSVPGIVRGEPVVVNGVVYEGIAGGDTWNGCIAGHIAAFDEHTGKLLPKTWYTSPKPKNGGGIFSPISYDASSKTLYFGTGNTCDETGTQNSIVAISSLDMKTRWVVSGDKPTTHEEALKEEAGGGIDVGCGITIRGDRVYCKSKSGFLYALDKNTGKKLWETDLQPYGGVGSAGIGTATGDGTMLMVNSGERQYRGHNDGLTSFVAFDLAGHMKYVLQEQNTISLALSAAFIPGIGFVSLDNSLIAFDSQTGQKLWSSATQDSFYASPAIVASGLYDVDTSGNVYAYALPAVTSIIGTPGVVALQNLNNPEIINNPSNGQHWKRILFGVVFGLGAIICAVTIFFTRRAKKIPEPQSKPQHQS